VAINSHAAMVQSQCDAAFFASLLEAFLEELPQRLKSMQKAWPHNAAEFKHHGHSLKGVAAALGLQSLHLVASKAESFAGQAVHPKPIELMPHLEGEIQSARFQIMRWLALNPPSMESSQ
jgi:HPt (histidine-containing phosphotransfer) domain-containing protein